MPPTPPLSATTLLDAFEASGVTWVVGLPDNDTAPLFALRDGHPRVRLVRVAREGEAFGVAAGLWLGGASAVVVLQNTGLLESGDALRGTASRMGVPLVLLVGYRGFAKMAARKQEPSAGPPSRDELVRADLDTVALMTEPTLAAWGVPFERLDGTDGRARLAWAFDGARKEARPVALLLTHTLAS